MSWPADPRAQWWRRVQAYLGNEWPADAHFVGDALRVQLEAAPGCTLTLHPDRSVSADGAPEWVAWLVGLLAGLDLLTTRDGEPAWDVDWIDPPLASAPEVRPIATPQPEEVPTPEARRRRSRRASGGGVHRPGGTWR